MSTWAESEAIAALTGSVDRLERGWQDTTLIRARRNGCVVLSSDQINESHAYPGEDVRSLVRRGVVEAVSDIAASGSRLHGVQIDVRAPHYFTTNDFAAIGLGVDDVLRYEGGLLLQGSNVSRGEFGVSTTAVGIDEADGEPLRRSGARAGEALALSGPVGGWNAALAVLNGGAADHATDEEWSRLVADFADYHSELSYGRVLRLSGAVSACVDANDGLAKTVTDLARGSEIRLVAEGEAIPRAPTVDLARRAVPGFDELASTIGGLSGDDRLLFTVRPEGAAALRDLLLTELGRDMYVIGHVESGAGVSWTVGGAPFEVRNEPYAVAPYASTFSTGARCLAVRGSRGGRVVRVEAYG